MALREAMHIFMAPRELAPHPSWLLELSHVLAPGSLHPSTIATMIFFLFLTLFINILKIIHRGFYWSHRAERRGGSTLSRRWM
jgi:hypothetical protein